MGKVGEKIQVLAENIKIWKKKTFEYTPLLFELRHTNPTMCIYKTGLWPKSASRVGTYVF